MSLQVRDSGTLRTITAMTVREAGLDREILTMKVQDGGVLRTVAEFASSLTVSGVPSAVAGFNSGGTSVPITTDPTTATPDGGRGPFTHSWTLLSGGPATAITPSMATTTFRATPGVDETILATFRVTTTDDAGQVATADVDATFVNFTIDLN